jgi:thiol-disulfide isomerase/thioredoxin
MQVECPSEGAGRPSDGTHYQALNRRKWGASETKIGETRRFGNSRPGLNPRTIFVCWRVFAQSPALRVLLGAVVWPIMVMGAGRRMKRSFILVLAMVAGLAGLAIGLAASRTESPRAMKVLRPSAHSASSASSASSAASKAKSTERSNEAHVVRFAAHPQPMPAFLVNDLDGNPVSTAAWKGKVVFVNFWATWCPPCRAEIPILIDLENRYKDRLQIVGVSVDDGDPADVKQFAKEAGINYPIVMADRAIVSEYGGVPALPTLFVVNPDGNVVQKHEGLFSNELYEAEVRSLLGLPVDATIETFEDTGQIFLKNAVLATELPNVDFTGLNPEQKKAALKRMNSENCDCGCTLTLAQCRINDTSCPISKKLAARVVKEIASNAAAPVPAIPAAAPPAAGATPVSPQPN